MTTPRDAIAGLIEDINRKAKSDEELDWYSVLEPAATQLDSLLKERDALQARVEKERASYYRAMRSRLEWRRLAEKAQQERDEAVTVIKFGLDVVSEERGWGTYQRMEGSEIYMDADVFRDAARDLVRRLSAGPEKEGK